MKAITIAGSAILFAVAAAVCLLAPGYYGYLLGTLATTAVSAWLGARVYRVHEVVETRQVLDMVSSIQGTRAPAVNRRGIVPEFSAPPEEP